MHYTFCIILDNFDRHNVAKNCMIGSWKTSCLEVRTCSDYRIQYIARRQFKAWSCLHAIGRMGFKLLPLPDICSVILPSCGCFWFTLHTLNSIVWVFFHLLPTSYHSSVPLYGQLMMLLPWLILWKWTISVQPYLLCNLM